MSEVDEIRDELNDAGLCITKPPTTFTHADPIGGQSTPRTKPDHERKRIQRKERAERTAIEHAEHARHAAIEQAKAKIKRRDTRIRRALGPCPYHNQPLIIHQVGTTNGVPDALVGCAKCERPEWVGLP